MSQLLKFNYTYLWMAGLIPYENRDAGFIKRKTINSLKYIYMLILLGVWLPFIYEVYLAEKTFIEYILNIVNIGAYLCSILTLYFFMKNGSTGRNLIIELNSIFHYKGDGISENVTVYEMDKDCKKITTAFLTLLNFGVTSMVVVPIIMSGRNLPLPGEYPGMNPINNTIQYVELYVFQTLGQWVISNVTAASDSFFICIILMSGKQVEIIGKNFRNCLYNTFIKYGVNKQEVLTFKDKFESSYSNNEEHLSVMKFLESVEFQKILRKSMISKINHHQAILNFLNRVDTFFLPVIFFKICISIFYHVFITFACLVVTEKSLMLALMEYEVCALTELLIFATAGQFLINKSEDVFTNLMESPWYICDLEFQKTFYMVLMRSGRVSKVSVGKLTNMSLPTFLLIMKTAASYLAVLRQVVE